MPVWPNASLLRWAQPVFWAVVLGFLALLPFSRASTTTRRLAMLVAMAWAFVPGAWSPTWWFGLAFQLPSWTTVLLCFAGCVAAWRPAVAFDPAATAKRAASGWSTGPSTATSLGILTWLALPLGIVLLLDMFILLPLAVYRWGFGPLALAVMLALVTLVWVMARGAANRREAALVLMALALFVVTRLPTGNVFDAVIDPWLWLVLLAGAVRQVVNAMRSRSTRG